jgi:myo-inositol-1-phosphate synthase
MWAALRSGHSENVGSGPPGALARPRQRYMLRAMSTTGVWIVGACGYVGTCTIAGWTALDAQLLPPTGLVSFGQPLGHLPFVSLDQVRFGGHEMRERRIADTVRGLARERILSSSVLDNAAVAARLDATQAELRPGVNDSGGTDDIDRIRRDLAEFRDRHKLDRVVVLNVASTEADPVDGPLPAEPDALAAALRQGRRLPASSVYAFAALDLGFGYVNFTPSTGSDLAALHALALTRGAVHAGRDGKTGQTLLKTVLAPMFAIRRLDVTSWVSHNVLGNDDGRALADAGRRAAKQRSKSEAVAAILGYAPESHVGIDYVPSYGDWKLAWDRIVFQGFGGAEMTLEMTWRGSDTALAAPLCIDLVRFAELAQRRGERGVLEHLALFFKAPMGSIEHRLERQWQALVGHVLAEAGRP